MLLSGLSCEKCQPGYTRQESGSWLGRCVSSTLNALNSFHGILLLIADDFRYPMKHLAAKDITVIHHAELHAK